MSAARLFCGITSGSDYESDQTFEYIPARPETPRNVNKPAASAPAAPEKAASESESVLGQFEVRSSSAPAPEADPALKVETVAEERSLFSEAAAVSSVAPVSSLVSPAKSIRDAARTLDPVPTRIKFGNSGLFIPSNGILAQELAKKQGSITAVTSGIENKEEKPGSSGNKDSSEDGASDIRSLFNF